MNKEKTIQQLQLGHKKFQDLIHQLNEKQLIITPVLGNWTVKDIIVHLSAWNWETAKEIDRILANNAFWPGRYEENTDEDRFNQQEIEKRKHYLLDNIIQEWEDSYQSLINKIMNLTDNEWHHQSNKDTWKDKSPVTVESLFTYEYEGDEHEGGHANQIKKFFSL